MKKILLVLFAFVSFNVFSQIQVKEGSFRKIDGYLMLDKEDHRDINWKPMALIKITAEGMKAEERARLLFHGNLETYFDVVQMEAETHLYISAQAATFIEIQHPDFGKTEYWFPEDLCDFCGYEMVVQYKNPQPELGFLAISSEPADADIYIDGKHYGKTNNVITDLSEGTHQLKLEKQGYVTLSKNINIVKGETLKLNETLQTLSSQKTFFIVKTDRPDARIYINDNLKNTGEHAESVLIGSTYTYRIECNLYHTETGSVTVNDKTTINKTLRPAFGYINITTSPEQGAKVFIDGNYIGLSPIKTDKLASGTHKVMVMKEMYNMKEQSFTVNDGQTTNATLNMSANFVTLTLTVDSDSDIYVDEEYKGKGRWTGRLSEGLHNIEAKKANHRTSKKTLDLVSGKDETITLEAPKPISGNLEIISSPLEADIYIDGRHYGQTPNVINELLIGTHELKLTKQGYAELKKTITIKEGETLAINEKLQANNQQTSGNNNVASGKTQTFTVKGVTFTMIAVEGGTFQMGATSEQGSDADSDEKPVHSVTLSDYYIGETEVTQELWEAVMGTNPSSFKGSKKPVESVSWNDCQTFIKKLNRLTGKNFRLPTEAEWEYAARGGNKSKGHKYSGSNTIGDVAWYWVNSNSTHDVKTKQANELGIYDMSGNVWEWCQDRYGDYSSSLQTNPTGPTSASYRVSRGGSWYYDAVSCRVSYRDYGSPDRTYNDLGLRLSLSQD